MLRVRSRWAWPRACPLANAVDWSTTVSRRSVRRELVHNLEPFTLDRVNDPFLTSTSRDG